MGNGSRLVEPSTSASATKKSTPVPQFSAIPKVPIGGSTIGLAKVKGLGQGSTKRLDERIAQ